MQTWFSLMLAVSPVAQGSVPLVSAALMASTAAPSTLLCVEVSAAQATGSVCRMSVWLRGQLFVV